MALDIVFKQLLRSELLLRLDDFIGISADVTYDYWSHEHFLLELPEKWILSVAAWRNDIPVAYAILSRKASKRAHIHHFMVSEQLRGRGLGARLLHAAFNRCLDRGCGEVTLKVLATNLRAQGFYCRHGFQCVGGPGDYLKMRRELDIRNDRGYSPT